MKKDFFAQIEAEIEEKEPLSLNVQGYEIQELIGGGGMGEVYRAILTARGRVVAMKVVSGRLTRDPEVTARFEAEVAALSQLSHHNVVRVLDHGETVNGRHFLVMEYVDGCDLRRLLRAQRMDMERGLDIFLKVCAGVSHAHQRGLVHRDIKPANILIGADGTVKVADFGLAKTLVENSTGYSFTQTRDTFGTPYYVAPEVTRSAGIADERADVYALGVLLYELLTGTVPMGQFTPLSAKTGLNKKIDSIVCQALADDPQRRLASVSELANTVEKIANDYRRRHEKKAWSRRVLAVAAVLTMMGLGVAAGAWISSGKLPSYQPLLGLDNARAAVPEKPWENSLGMKFVPLAGTSLLFCTQETRVKDYVVFGKVESEFLPNWRAVALAENDKSAADSIQTPTSWANPGFAQGPDHPVCGMSQLDARFFCAWLTNHEVETGWLKPGQVYRLPTDAEWSLAACIEDDPGPYSRDALPLLPNILPTGNFAGPEVRQYPLWPVYWTTDAPEDMHVCTAPVGAFPPNPHGLYDMHGNVAEWTASRVEDRRGFPPDLYFLRGGSWATGRLLKMRPEARMHARRTTAQPTFGFRVVLDLEAKALPPRPLDPLNNEN
ncbi:serine/threonine protein kinase [Prosthecobacter fusiformis]|uniref:Serine/threonine protein kinase n=1 Tax=Prosthecobacter fusiformis TaxID=48464 RepID=A0A4R7SPM1_9BACT|nr:bifunctional serine/threonine-protein kinase/formylglycine-generating enzyme family protein [Prosthecobacter fusiformis]TDU81162.1 serine/threonine protein kinase [Prosthecobacter fusiformis]